MSNRLELLALLSPRTVNLSAMAGGSANEFDWTNVAGALAKLDVLQQRYIQFVYCDDNSEFVILQLELASELQKADRELWDFNFVDVIRCVKGVLLQCREDKCGQCSGTGLVGQSGRSCPGCNGSGYDVVSAREWSRRTGLRYDRRDKLMAVCGAVERWCRDVDWTAAKVIGDELHDQVA